MADLTNRVYGPAGTRRVVFFVFDSLLAGLWWHAPLALTLVGSVLNMALSSTINFSERVPFFRNGQRRHFLGVGYGTSADSWLLCPAMGIAHTGGLDSQVLCCFDLVSIFCSQIF